eukprot:gnl/TRDRNA2_/TRDRNA2_36307_c0_seq1.p1 gnl/TRDRNA2_/TRDRNA2_36307_c0~~gnl/TRDRNA2_/TRDRNA2_36307_c0_seq1.p1  ORF type:complete len:385 (-),score=56.69 gnl/TRDRNA2_/TRDRNA2_36307_c0_seq1:29-1105(-)
MAGGANASAGTDDALGMLLAKEGHRVIGSRAGDTRRIITGSAASYAVKHEIGEGSYGEVWKAHVLEVFANTFPELHVGDPVAIKILINTDVSEEVPGQGELESMRACTHPHILKGYDSCSDRNGDRCLIMEFVEGVTLEDYLLDVGDELREEEACRIFAQILDAVKCLHSADIIHCDLKASNFMLDAAKNVKMIDFGSACKRHATRAPRQKMRGTAIYCAPEQMDMEEFDERVDLWSIGVILHELLTGGLPEDIYEIVRHGHELPEPSEKKFKDSAWTLVKSLLVSVEKRAPECGKRLGKDIKSVEELAEEWSQDITYGDESFCEGAEEHVVHEEEDGEYDGADFDSCSTCSSDAEKG